MNGSRAAVTIETPEGIRFSLPLAGPMVRFLAWLIDMLAIGSGCSIAAQILRAFSIINADIAAALTLISFFVISVGYGISFEWFWNGQSLGKRVIGLRVVDASGMKLQFSQIAIRNLMRFLDALPGLYLIGGAAMLMNRKAQRLGDLIASTIVVKQNLRALSDLGKLHRPEKYNSLLEVPHLAARVRQRASPELAFVAYEALSRRDTLEPAARLEVFRRLAQCFRELTAFPEELTESLTDERYVRNALEVLVTSRSLRGRNGTFVEATSNRHEQNPVSG